MRGETTLDLVLLGECLLVSPRGSLFGVFLGEEGATESPAREPTASWTRAGSLTPRTRPSSCRNGRGRIRPQLRQPRARWLLPTLAGPLVVALSAA